MGQRNQQGRRPMGIFCISTIFILGVISCSSVPHLKVDYRLPPSTEELKGQKVVLSFSDVRRDKEILGKGARDKFRDFSGKILFSLSRGTEEGFMVGVYDLPLFIRELFKRRLENEGLGVLGPGETGDSEIQIALEEFKLDFMGGKWHFKMAYQARLKKEGKVLSRQMIRGRGERLRVIGTGDAHKIVGESLTDLVNQLDVGRLLRQAGM
ncbi:MAG: hypothetical protein JRH06_02200 [Deltaproteobacteria bacterium]|nr:hypothetical protein [Deltaproteobacteria bacterium]MBW2136350.1 hypothetical protein [Deltaproteobacteria bacterium]